MAVSLPGQTSGFNSVGDYIDANQGTLANETGQINAGVGSQIDAAKGAADALVATDKGSGFQQDYTTLPGYGDALHRAIKAKDQATSLGTESGVADYLKQKMGDTDTQSHFDAGILGFDPSKLQARPNLSQYLDDRLEMASPIIAPGANTRQPSPGMDPKSGVPGQVTPYVPPQPPPGPPPNIGPNGPIFGPPAVPPGSVTPGTPRGGNPKGRSRW